jgi:bisanhydrobacterioruberin hydratase
MPAILNIVYPKQAYKREQIALYIALAFHGFGLIGMLNQIPFFINNTATNLVVCFLLILYTHRKINLPFISFLIFAFGIGFLAEIIGVNTGYLFGNYSYGNLMGPKFLGVPYLIGVQWLVTLYCCCMAFAFLQRYAQRTLEAQGMFKAKKGYNFSFLIDVAFIAVFFDWVLEPVAIQLNYWAWLPNGDIPSFNYLCWFICSIPIAWCFKWCQVYEFNKFAIHLLMIQVLFFLILRCFL